jgi:hypothetical protein
MDALIQVISKAAPLLGGVIGGPAGVAIGSLIASKFGGNSQDTDDLLARIQADPQSAVKLLEIQTTHKEEIEKIHLAMAHDALKYDSLQRFTEFKDRASARQRESDLAKAGMRDYTASTLAYLLTLGVFMALCYLFVHGIPEDNKEIIVTVISALTTVWVMAMGYYFGSTSNNKKIENELDRKS